MKSHQFPALILGLLLFTGGGSSFAEEPLTLRQAIDMAMAQNAEVAVAQADGKVAQAEARSARTNLLPSLQFTEDISRGNDPVYAFGTRLRQGAFTQADFGLNALNRPEAIGNFSTRFSGSWTAFDSFKTQREIRRADLSEKSAALASRSVNQRIALDVVRAYQSILYAQREVEVAQHEQETASALLSAVEERVKAGLAVESDQMLAEVNSAARRQDLIVAEGDMQLAWADLREAVGSPQLQISGLKALEPRTYPEAALEEELGSAMKARPDLLALAESQAAQAVGVKAAKSALGPRVNAYGNWEEDRGALDRSGGNNWTVGAQVSIDILPLGKRAQLAQENAAQERVNAQAALSMQRARLEVTRAHIRRQTEKLSMATAQAAMEQSAESLRIVRNRYRAGLATITDLLRAEDAERQSQSNYWHAVYGNVVAYAELLFATGNLTPEAAEVLQ